MKKWKPVLCALLIAAIGCSVTLGVAAAPQAEVFNEQRTKISHSQSPIKTVDGIVDYIGDGVVSAADQGQGDRGRAIPGRPLPMGTMCMCPPATTPWAIPSP